MKTRKLAVNETHRNVFTLTEDKCPNCVCAPKRRFCDLMISWLYVWLPALIIINHSSDGTYFCVLHKHDAVVDKLPQFLSRTIATTATIRITKHLLALESEWVRVVESEWKREKVSRACARCDYNLSTAVMQLLSIWPEA